MKPSILISYAYWTKAMEETARKYEGKYNLFLDSGAYTSYKQGKKTSLDEYCSFVAAPPVAIERYFTLDVIGDPTETRKNLDQMLSRGLAPIPIFTRGQELKEINDLYRLSDLIAIGGVAGTNNAKEYLRWVMPATRKRKVHWLGFFVLDFLQYYCPYSCDTTVFSQGSQYGRGTLFGRKPYGFTRKTFQDVPGLKKFCRQNSIDYYSLKLEVPGWRQKDSIGWSTVQKITCCSFLQKIKRLEEACGVRTFLACATGGEDSSGTSLSKVIRMAERID